MPGGKSSHCFEGFQHCLSTTFERASSSARVTLIISYKHYFSQWDNAAKSVVNRRNFIYEIFTSQSSHRRSLIAKKSASLGFAKAPPLTLPCSPGHSGEYGNAAKLLGKMSKSVMQLIAIHFFKLVLVSDNEKSPEQA